MLKLPRLSTNFRIVDERGVATMEFQQFWQNAMTQIEASINGVESALAAAGIALDAADAAQAAADAADAAAASAADAATNVTESAALANSYVSGLTLTATDAGSNVTVTISGHTRVYATSPSTSVSVTGGSVTALAYSTTYYFYYDQASRLGGAVTYVATTNIDDIAQLGNRHSVGSVMTPAAASPPTNGGGTAPPGGSFAEP